jgi:hypothetical protein
MFPYPDDSRTYSLEISRIFGFLSILFAILIPLTGCIMGIVGLYYENKDAKEHGNKYSYPNLALNALGMIIGGLYMSYWLIFKVKILG